MKTINPIGLAFKAPGEVHFGRTLRGRSLHDAWMTYDKKLKKPKPVGTAIRLSTQ